MCSRALSFLLFCVVAAFFFWFPFLCLLFALWKGFLCCHLGRCALERETERDRAPTEEETQFCLFVLILYLPCDNFFG